jgi:hypothetical protein
MPPRALTFRQKDVTRAIRVTKAAGVDIARIEVEPSGKIVIIAGTGEQRDQREGNEWDRV